MILNPIRGELFIVPAPHKRCPNHVVVTCLPFRRPDHAVGVHPSGTNDNSPSHGQIIRRGSVPEGRLTIAQRFSVGWRRSAGKVPQGRLTGPGDSRVFSRPFGTRSHRSGTPNAKALGYCRVSLRDKDRSPRMRDLRKHERNTLVQNNNETSQEPPLCPPSSLSRAAFRPAFRLDFPDPADESSEGYQ